MSKPRPYPANPQLPPIVILNNRRATKPPLAKGRISEIGSLLHGGNDCHFFTVHDTGADAWIRVVIPNEVFNEMMLEWEVQSQEAYEANRKKYAAWRSAGGAGDPPPGVTKPTDV